jgi:hypothetical protein
MRALIFTAILFSAWGINYYSAHDCGSAVPVLACGEWD